MSANECFPFPLTLFLALLLSSAVQSPPDHFLIYQLNSENSRKPCRLREERKVLISLSSYFTSASTDCFSAEVIPDDISTGKCPYKYKANKSTALLRFHKTCLPY